MRKKFNWIRCPICFGEIEAIPDVCKFGYFCPHCEDILFEQTVIVVCEICQKEINRFKEILTFSDYQGTTSRSMTSTCQKCIEEWDDEG